MSSPDGWTEGEGDLPFLPQQDGFDGVRRFFDDLLRPPVSYDRNEPIHHVICCVCRGAGRITEVIDSGDFIWDGGLRPHCPACDGSGSVGMVRERKGTR